MAKILRDIPVEKQIARHMEEWERRRLEESRTFKSSLARPIAEIGPCITISRELGRWRESACRGLKHHWCIS